MPSVFELLFDTYGDHLMQEQVPYDEAEIQAALDRMSMPQDMQIRQGNSAVDRRVVCPPQQIIHRAVQIVGDASKGNTGHLLAFCKF